MYLKYITKAIPTISQAVIVPLMFCLAIGTQESAAYNLNDAISNGLKNSSFLKAEKEKLIESAILRKQEAYTGFMPNIVADISDNKERFLENTNFPNNALNTQNKTLSMEVELFGFGRSVARVKGATHGMRAAEASYQAAVNKLILEIIDTYSKVVAFREHYALKVQQEKSMSQMLERSKFMASLGHQMSNDIAYIEANLAEAKASTQVYLNRLSELEGVFRSKVGEPAPNKMDEVNISRLNIPGNLSSFVQTAKTQNPYIIDAKENLIASQYAVKAVTADMLPNLSLRVSASRNATIPLLQSNSSENAVLLHLKIPLFERGIRQVELGKAKSEYRRIENTLHHTELAVESQALSNWDGHRTQVSTLNNRYSEVRSKELYFTLLDEQFKAGATTAIELVRARNLLDESKGQLANDKMRTVITVFEALNTSDNLKDVDFATMTMKKNDTVPSTGVSKGKNYTGNISDRKVGKNESVEKGVEEKNVHVNLNKTSYEAAKNSSTTNTIHAAQNKKSGKSYKVSKTKAHKSLKRKGVKGTV